MKFIILDGKIIENKEAKLKPFIVEGSISLSQKIWFGFGGIPLFFENIELMSRQTDYLKIPLPGTFKDKRELFRITKRLLNKNKLYRSGYLNIQIFVNGSQSHTIITCRPFSEFDFPFTKEGLLICFSSHKKYSGNFYNRYAPYNKTLWDIALSELKGTFFKNAVILNEKNMVCECAYANIFMLKDKNIFTPPLSSGCYEDIMRNLVIEAAKSLGKTIVETREINKNDLFQMDEIFIAGEQTGLSWILGVDNKRFLHNFSSKIYNRLNEYLKKKVS